MHERGYAKPGQGIDRHFVAASNRSHIAAFVDRTQTPIPFLRENPMRCRKTQPAC
jgi:hypothetical protein